MRFALKSLLAKLDVALVSGPAQYPAEPPFHPPEIYPEYTHEQKATDPNNAVYAMARDSLRLLGMDETRFGLADWNPLG
jgi:hypothetical protein